MSERKRNEPQQAPKQSLNQKCFHGCFHDVVYIHGCFHDVVYIQNVRVYKILHITSLFNIFPDFNFCNDSRDEEHNNSLLRLCITLKCFIFCQHILTYPATLILLFFKITVTGN